MITLLAFILFSIFQMSQIYAAKEVMLHASTAGARARTVGFNDFMVYKVVKSASIPNAGLIVHPDVATSTLDINQWLAMTPGEAFDASMTAYPRSIQSPMEEILIPLYLGAENWAELPGILDYQDWDSVGWPSISDIGGDILQVRAAQDLPLRYPFHRAFVDRDYLWIEGMTRMDNHYPIYLQ
jgi:hypothetical protein